MSILVFMVLIRALCQVKSDRAVDSIDTDELRTDLEEMEASVAVAIIIQNQSRYKLELEQVDVTCGVFSNNQSLPEEVWPGEERMTYFAMGPRNVVIPAMTELASEVQRRYCMGSMALKFSGTRLSCLPGP